MGAGAVLGGGLIRLTVDMVRKLKSRQKSDQIEPLLVHGRCKPYPSRWGCAVVSLTANRLV